jgi:hypothetical protein
MLRISHSRLKTWRRCHKQYDYRYNKKIEKRLKGRALQVGTIIHECIETAVTGGNWLKTLKKHEDNLDSYFIEEIEEMELGNVIQTCGTLVEEYLKFYKKDGITYKAVEQEFSVPLIEEKEIFFIGKIDAVVSEQKKPWLFERKTCSKIPDEEIRMSDIQAVLYWWALPQFMNIDPAGVIWDYVRTKAPAVPEPLKAGGLTQRKNIDTLHSIYLKEIVDKKLNTKDYKEILESLKGKEANFFRRIRLPFSKELRDQIVKETKSTALEIHRLGKVLKDRNMTYDCNRCDYFKLCQAELRGLDTDFILKKYYKERKKDEKEELK